MRKLKSNSRKLVKLRMDAGLSNSDTVDEHQLKVLGLNWNPKKDELSPEKKGLVEPWKSLRNSKIYVSLTVENLFDPIDFISPFVLTVETINSIAYVATLIYTDEIRDDPSRCGIVICIKLASNHIIKILKRDPDLCSVCRSELVPYEEGLDYVKSASNPRVI
ncbi:uncharacterized protein NPIL_573461 [Nephila pilipes]|uniref:Uncharacterized protein n=1 Tax=Nephila pilipes TaxID=299642 RepID=A0A8X6N3G6_NEPPI|nr:uncharacterized protein NPIL_573461 [Nephila pilipes]